MSSLGHLAKDFHAPPPIKIELNNEQTQKLLDATDVVAILVGLGSLIEPISATVLGAWIKVNRIRIARANKGYGVIIVIPRTSLLARTGSFSPSLVDLLFASVKPR